MTKEALITLADSHIDELLSSGEMYQSAYNESKEAFKKYTEKHPDDAGFTRQVDFMDESVFNNAIRISVKETIKLLCENGLINISEK